MTTTSVILEMLNAGALALRDVTKGEFFLYSSGWKGPGYVNVKGLVTYFGLMQRLCAGLARKIASSFPEVEFVAGNVTGGVIPGWLVARFLELILNKPIPYMYIRGSRVLPEGPISEFPFTMTNKEATARKASMIRLALHEKIHQNSSFFVAGAAPGGMALATVVCQLLTDLSNSFVPLVYIREQKKKGGHKELLTGLPAPSYAPGALAIAIGQDGNFVETCNDACQVLKKTGFNPLNVSKLLDNIHVNYKRTTGPIEEDFNSSGARPPKGARGLVVEELVNFLGTTSNSVELLRMAGYEIRHAATILDYENPVAVQTAIDRKITLIRELTLNEMLLVVEEAGSFSSALIADYRNYLADPTGWNKRNGFTQDKGGGTQ